ncbi:hypothetical protein O181_022690 [Austropuccinia psidii MF-1]|uniref:Uncharacterized protein n=1 Tax=Austropuccinia psidii MF-1 TaxID=1389203 RepID=A0A9Q3CH34_9BASI|nr:hypothetical protein [Austropuccinia psidii MF-1]
MSPVHLRNLGILRNQPEDRPEHHGHHSGWQETEGNNTNSTIHLPIQQKPQTRGLEGYGSSSSAPPTTQRLIPMEHGQQGPKPSIKLGITSRKLLEGMSQRAVLDRSYGNHQRMESQQAVQTCGGEGNQDKGEYSPYSSYIRAIEPDRAYYESFSLTRRKPTRLPSSFTPFSQKKLPFLFTIPGSFQEKQGYKVKNKTSLSHRQRESDKMIQKLLDLVKEVHKIQK